MQVVWMTRMEQRSQETGNSTGLVSAGEENGKWLVLWESEDGKLLEKAGLMSMEQPDAQVWYEGQSWQEMRAALRSGMAKLLHEGYQPSLGFMPDTNLHERRMKEQNEWIICYGDLYVNDKLYEQLAQWRRETAGTLRRAPYWIATNRMLRLVSAFVPQTADELKQLPGFGEAKVKSYGDALLAITQKVERQTSFPLDWVGAVVTERAFVEWVYEQEKVKMDSELLRLKERRVLLEGIRDGLQALELMEQLQVDRRELLVRVEALAEEGYDMMSFIQKELADVTLEELTSIRSALTELGMEYLKPVFVHIYGEEALNGAGIELQRRYEYIRLMRLTMATESNLSLKRGYRKQPDRVRSA